LISHEDFGVKARQEIYVAYALQYPFWVHLDLKEEYLWPTLKKQHRQRARPATMAEAPINPAK
jgi:hypothetical protein